MIKIVFATKNENKIKEIQNILPNTLEIISLSDIGCKEEIPETQNTIKGNAIQKANYIKSNYNLDCFADDTGLEVKALNGRPGVYSARYAGPNCSAADNMDKLLNELENHDDRSAKFRTVITLILNGEKYYFEGKVLGDILSQKKGVDGFGYDPIFRPKGFSASFAEMSMTQKNEISHRGIAVKKLIQFLSDYS